MILRFIINPPEIIKDKQNAGYRAKQIPSNYDYGYLDTNDDDYNDQQIGHLYSMGVVWVQFEMEESIWIQILLHKFWVYIAGCDKITLGFE
ncbi:hypothetical protein pb186bvf_005343 [Paramecium bursaria]